MDSNLPRFIAVSRDDYDDSIKIGKKEYSCYSLKKMKRKYPNGGYDLLGEAVWHSQKDPVASFTNSDADDTALQVSSYHSYDRLLYEKVGYVLIDEAEKKYILLLKNRLSYLLLWLVLLLGIVISMSLTLSSVFGPREGGNVDYIQPQHDVNVQTFDDGNGSQKMDAAKGGGAVSMTFSKSVSVNLSSNTIQIFVGNPIRSNQNMSVQIIVTADGKDNNIGESGLIVPGKSLKKIVYKPGGIALSAGNYDGYINVRYYNNSGEKALIESHINVAITVK